MFRVNYNHNHVLNSKPVYERDGRGGTGARNHRDFERPVRLGTAESASRRLEG